MPIKNIVFDVGNVLVRWDPVWIIENTFASYENKEKRLQQIFNSGIWADLNLGKFSETETIEIYHQKFGIEQTKLQRLMETVKHSLTPLPGSFEFFNELHEAGYHLYLLTDNVHEIVSHLKARYDFWHKVKGAVVSAEIGHLKPSAEIYQHLLRTHDLIPHETVFFDDLAKNIEGAKKHGIHGIQFTDAEQARQALKIFSANH
ncbi:MAG: superfamily hydrolase [Gammaproteobacteria bacterium]|jgi:putative hydrolase of the HAD superfamily|nr:superfamily hydrolase [Gammaproteobacteria bacterium]